MVRSLTNHPRWLAPAVLVAAVSVACGSGSGPMTLDDPSTLAGTWVAENVVLTVTDADAHLEMPCAHGDTAGAITQNPFSVVGTFARDVGPALIERPAVYTGRVVGGTMTLEIRLTDTNELAGSLKLTRGSPGRFAKCV